MGETQTLCRSCQQIDIVGMLRSEKPAVSCWLEPQMRVPVPDQDHIDAAFEDRVRLGKVKSISFDLDCPLCRILKSAVPAGQADSEDELELLPSWAIERVEPSIGVWWKDLNHGKDNAFFRMREINFGKTLFLARLKPTAEAMWRTNFFDRNERGTLTFAHHAYNALSICDDGPNAPVMSGRKLSERIDYDLLKKWITNCAANHKDICKVTWESGLRKIRLVDTWTRQVVQYSEKAEYLCLSYVWGNVRQPNVSLGPLPGHLPLVIEDAIKVVVGLGKRYLWVDSICIEQHNSIDKLTQISLMGAIYRGAFATIVALSGDSANSSLSRVGQTTPDLSQEVFCVNGTTIVSLLPTLRQQIAKSTWKTRAWTFQEGQLSPRLLYFCHDQIYYECSGGQCCETVIDPFPIVHTWTNANKLVTPPFHSGAQQMLVQGCFSIESGARYNAILRYDEYIREYSARRLSYDSDGLNAVSAMLEQLGKAHPDMFDSGFAWGLPVDDLACSLLWYRQMSSHRRNGFPSWSWVGWHGPLQRVVYTNKHHDRPQSPQRRSSWVNKMYPLSGPYFLEISRLENEKLSPIYQANPHEDIVLDQYSWISKDQLHNTGYPAEGYQGSTGQRGSQAIDRRTNVFQAFKNAVSLKRKPLSANKFVIPNSAHLIYIETIVFRPIFSNFSCVVNQAAPAEEYSYAVTIANLDCTIACYTPEVARMLDQNSSKHHYLAVMHREFDSYWWISIVAIRVEQ